jgi:hypothetical protein
MLNLTLDYGIMLLSWLMIVTKGGDVKPKVMVTVSLINYTLCHVRKLWIANFLRIISQYTLEWRLGKTTILHKLLTQSLWRIWLYFECPNHITCSICKAKQDINYVTPTKWIFNMSISQEFKRKKFHVAHDIYGGLQMFFFIKIVEPHHPKDQISPPLLWFWVVLSSFEWFWKWGKAFWGSILSNELHTYWLQWIYNTSLPNAYFQKFIYQASHWCV